MAETERDRLERNAAVILAGVVASLLDGENITPATIAWAIDAAEAVHAEIQKRQPYGWEKQETPVEAELASVTGASLPDKSYDWED